MSAPAEFLQEQAWLYARLDDLLIRRGSDLFLSANAPPAVKVNGQLVRLSDQAIGGDTTLAIAQAIMTPLQFGHFQQTKESNFAIAPADRPRFRVNAFMQLGQVGMVFRAIAVNPPNLDGLGLPEALKTIALQKRGLVILVGATGAGKSTIARALERRLFDMGRAVAVLDGQNMRLGISRDLGFSAGERSENLRRSAEVAKLFNDAGLLCIAAFVLPTHEWPVDRCVNELVALLESRGVI